MKHAHLILVLFLLCGCGLRNNPEAEVRRRSEGFAAKHGLELKYFKEKKVGKKIAKIHLGYFSPKVLTMDESRRMIVDVTEGLLRRFNRNETLKERLYTYPLTAQQLDIVIHYDPLFGEYFGREDTGKMVLTEGKIHFIDFDGKLRNREPYNRARQILRDQILEQTRIADSTQTKEQSDWLISQVGKEDRLTPIRLITEEPTEVIVQETETTPPPAASTSAAVSQLMATGHSLDETVYRSMGEIEQVQEHLVQSEEESEQLIASSIDRLVSRELEQTQTAQMPSVESAPIAEAEVNEPDLSNAQERVRKLPMTLEVAEMAPSLKPSTTKLEPLMDTAKAKQRLAQKRMRQVLEQSNEPVLVAPPVPLLDLSEEDEKESLQEIVEEDELPSADIQRGDVSFENEIWPD